MNITTANQAISRKYVIDYLACAIWSSYNPETHEPLDSDYGLCDFSTEARLQGESDLADFLDYCDEQTPDWFDRLSGDYGFEQLAHDFWLTRNGHGTGFWDRGLGKLGDELTEHADTFGPVDIYVSDQNELEIA